MHKKQYKETVIVATSVTGGVVLVSVGLAVLITTISVAIKCACKPSHRKRDSEGVNREEAVYEEIQMTVNPGYEQIMFSSPQYDNL
jgi:1-aminocyclopropane-1-carboxylate deaminase/D-cysteine desulfhydrase-like pyridoxal-dependent ACC family enzyme